MDDKVSVDDAGRLQIAKGGAPQDGNIETIGCRIAAFCAGLASAVVGIWLFGVANLVRSDPPAPGDAIIRGVCGAGGGLCFAVALGLLWWALTLRRSWWFAYGLPILATVGLLVAAIAPFSLSF